MIFTLLLASTCYAQVERWELDDLAGLPSSAFISAFSGQRIAPAYIKDPLFTNYANTPLLFAGLENGSIYGMRWSGIAWTLHPALDQPSCTGATPEVVCDLPIPGHANKCWMLVGCLDGTLRGYRWEGASGWQSDTASITPGLLGDYGSRTTTTIAYNPIESLWELIVTRNSYSDPHRAYTWDTGTNQWVQGGNIAWNARWGSIGAPSRSDSAYNIRGNQKVANINAHENWAPAIITNTWLSAYSRSEIGYWRGDGEYTSGFTDVWGYDPGCSCYTPGGWNQHYVAPSIGKDLRGNGMSWFFGGENRNGYVYAFYWMDNRPPIASDFVPPSNSWFPQNNFNLTFSLNERGDCYAMINPLSGPGTMNYSEIRTAEIGGDPFAVDCTGDGTFKSSCDIINLQDWQIIGGSGYNVVTVACRDTLFQNEDSDNQTTNLLYGVDTTPPDYLDQTPLNGTPYSIGWLANTANTIPLGTNVSDMVMTTVWLETNESGSFHNYSTQPWIDPNQPYRRKIVISNIYTPYDTKNYTLFIGLRWNATIGMDFEDIRFYDLVGNPLTHDVAAVEGAGPIRKAHVYVRLPTLHAFANETIYMYYGNLTDYPDTSDPQGTYIYYNTFDSDPGLDCGPCTAPTGYPECWEEQAQSHYRYDTTEEAFEFSAHRGGLANSKIFTEYINISNNWETKNPHFEVKMKFDQGDCTNIFGLSATFGLSDEEGWYKPNSGPTEKCSSSVVGFKLDLSGRSDVKGVRPVAGEVPIKAFISTPEGEILGAACDFAPIDDTYHTYEIEVNGSQLIFKTDFSPGQICDKFDISEVALEKINWKHFVAMEHVSRHAGSSYAEGYLDNLTVHQQVPISPTVFIKTAETYSPGMYSTIYDSPQNLFPTGSARADFPWNNHSTNLINTMVWWRVHMEDMFSHIGSTPFKYFNITSSNPTINLTHNSTTGWSSALTVDLTEGNHTILRAEANDTDCNIIGCTSYNPACLAGSCATYPTSNITWNVYANLNTLIWTEANDTNPIEKENFVSGFPELNDSTESPYNVTARIYDSIGQYAQAFRIVNVLPFATFPPVSDPNGPYTCEVGEEITLRGSGSYDEDEPGCGAVGPCIGLNYRWEIFTPITETIFDGDARCNLGWGGKCVETHYTCPATSGTYRINLTVGDSQGNTDEKRTTLDVYPSLSPADLVVAEVYLVNPLVEDSNNNITVLVSNTGQRNSQNYNISYKIKDSADVLVAGGWKREKGLPGGTTRKNITLWIPMEPGAYMINITVLEDLTGERHTRMIPVFVEKIQEYSIDEYPLWILLLILIAVPTLSYFLKENTHSSGRD